MYCPDAATTYRLCTARPEPEALVSLIRSESGRNSVRLLVTQTTSVPSVAATSTKQVRPLTSTEESSTVVGSPEPEMVRVVWPSEEPYGGYTDVMTGVSAIEYVNVWPVACVDAMLKSVSLGPNDTCESGCSFSMTTVHSLVGDSFFPKN